MPTPPPNSVHPKSRSDWRKWLEEHQSRAEGVWFISYKKASAKRAILEWIFVPTNGVHNLKN